MSGAPTKYEGIIVLGSPRSGTTLLRRLLGAHPNIACPPETNVFTAIGRFLKEDPIAEGVRLGPVSGLAFAGIPPDETIGRLRELCFGFFRSIAQKQGKPRWASKTAWDCFYVDEIERLCGDHSQFICIRRHGLDVICSVQELCLENESYQRELYDYVRRHPFPLEAFAHMWVDVTERIARFAAAHRANTLEIRYEDLAADPRQVMSQVFEFVGETPDAAIVERALANKSDVGFGDFKAYQRTSIDQASVGRSKSLSPHTRSQLGKIINPTLEASGYPLAPTLAERSDDDVRRRHELGLLVQAMKRPE
jgi:protein-tyrosine sulfotransferase